MNSHFFLQLLVALLPVLMGVVVTFVMELLKHVGSWLEDAPGYLKQAVALVFAMLVTWATSHGIPITATDLGALSSPEVQALLTWLISHVVYIGNIKSTSAAR